MMLWLGTAMLTLALAACGDDTTTEEPTPTPPDPKPGIEERDPSVTLELMAVDHQSATFSVTCSDADMCAVVILDEEPQKPLSAEEILSDDNAVEFRTDVPGLHTLEELEAETSRYVYAAAGAADEEGTMYYATAELTVTTTERPVTELITQSPNTLWYDGIGEDGSDNYYIGLCDTEIRNLDGSYVPESRGHYLLFMDLYGANTTDKENPVLAEGTYTLGENKTAGTLHNKYSGAVDFQGNSVQLTAGEVTVARENDIYTIRINYTLTDGTEIKASYVGGLKFEIGRVVPKVPKIENDVNTTFTGVKAIYTKAEMTLTGYDQITLCLFDKEPNAAGEQVDGYLLTCEIVMTDVDRYNIDFPSRQYNVTTDYQPYTTPVGDVVAISETAAHQIGTTLRHIDGATGEIRYAAIVDGHLTINSSDNNETYTVDVEMTTAEGYTLKGSYYGPIPVEGELPPRGESESPLYEDKVIDLGTEPKLTVKYREYSKVFLIEGKGSPVNGEHADGFRIEINASDDMPKSVIPCGTFRPGTTPGTFRYGSVDRTDGTLISGSFGYIDYLVELFISIYLHEAQAYAPATDGKVTITDNGDGTHTVEYEMFDDASPANKITCSVTGKFEFE